VHVTGLIDTQDGLTIEPLSEARHIRRRTPRLVSDVESELRRLYLRLMDEPVPTRLIAVLRTRSTSKP
jgi:hypothetical protein